MAEYYEPSATIVPKYTITAKRPSGVCPFAGGGVICNGHFTFNEKYWQFVYDYHECERCGWNPEEQERRVELLKKPEIWKMLKKKGVFNVPWPMLES